MHPERPGLEGFGGNALFIPLCNGDRVQEPVGATLVGDVFRAVGEHDDTVDGMPVPVLGAGELPQIDFGESRGLGHDLPLLYERPHGGDKRWGGVSPQLSAAVIAFWGAVGESSVGSMWGVGLSRDGDNERAAVSEADPAFRLFKTGPVDWTAWEQPSCAVKVCAWA